MAQTCDGLSARFPPTIRPAFHGRTGYALALTASKAVQREGYPEALDIIRAPYAYPYRSPVGDDPIAAAHYSLSYLRDAILDEGTDIAGIVVESLAGEVLACIVRRPHGRDPVAQIHGIGPQDERRAQHDRAGGRCGDDCSAAVHFGRLCCVRG